MEQQQQQLKNFAGQVNSLSFMGRQEIICGNRIVYGDSKQWWKTVCYHKDKSVYVAINPNEEIDKEVGWYNNWSGYKVIPNTLCYQGTFLYFYRHTHPSQQAHEWRKEGNDEGYYVGEFKYDEKHGQGEIVLNNQIQEKGKWQKGYRQWHFYRQTYEQGQWNTKNVYFYNNVDLGSQSPSKEYIAKTFPGFPVSRACNGITISEQLVRSLQPNEWVTSSVVDLFVNHLEKSFYDSQRRKSEIRYFRVETFQSMVPSMLIESGQTENVLINYSNVEQYGHPYKNLLSIFRKYPLILMPYNISGSHFQLLYIRTNCHYINGKLEQVQFYLGHLDPLYESKQYIFDYLKQYIMKEIQTNIHEAERHIYCKALKEAIQQQSTHLINSRNIKFTKQSNSHDCGMFVCLYMLLLTAEYGLDLQVNWLFHERYATKLREFIKKDALFGIGNFLELLLDRVVYAKVW